MLAGQVKEVTKNICRICGQFKEISFYSYELCRECCVCPTCGERNGLKTFTYICLATNQQITGIRCKCGGRFDERADMDEKLLARHASIPHRICKVCHGDVVSLSTEIEGFVNFCEQCRVCPTCSCRSIELEGSAVRCGVCGKRWENWADFEEYCGLRVDLGFC